MWADGWLGCLSGAFEAQVSPGDGVKGPLIVRGLGMRFEEWLQFNGL